jgi:hypothetical protein
MHRRRRRVRQDVSHRPGWLRAGTAGFATVIAGGLLAGGGTVAHAAGPGAATGLTGGLQTLLASVRSSLPALVAQQASTPAVAPAAAPAPSGHMPVHAAPQATQCVSALDGSLQPFTAHLKFAHLERQIPDQIDDIKATNQYVLTHTVLVQAMAAPLQEGFSKVLDGTPGPFFTHLKFAHLERSPFEQVEDIKATDRYVKTHTALVEAMTAPAGDVVAGC